MADGNFHHRSTLKQQNKPFKSKHSSKGALKKLQKGKVDLVASSVKNKHNLVSHKADRRNAAKLVQQKKRDEIVASNRLFQGVNAAPKIVAVVPLCPDVDAGEVIRSLFASVEQQYSGEKGPVTLVLERFKQRLQLIPLERHLLDILDALKVADFVIFVMSAEIEVDAFGKLCLSAIMAQGMPSVLSFVQHLEKVPAKLQPGIRKSLTLFIEDRFPGEQKIYSVGNATDSINSLRYLTAQRPKPVIWRDRHAYMLGEKVEFEGNAMDEEKGTLKVTGYVRGNYLNANRLVHLQGHGDFQIKMVVSCPTGQNKKDMGMALDEQVLHVPDPEKQESLIAENDPDPMEGEQTWPTEEELKEADDRVRRLGASTAGSTTSKSSKKKKLVPKGTSAYQAAWIIDDEDDEDGSDDAASANGDVEMMDHDTPEGEHVDWNQMNLGHGSGSGNTGNGKAESEEDEEEYEELKEEDEKDGEKDEFDVEYDEENEDRVYQEYLAKQKQEREDLEFPDEVDTPRDVAASVRFQRYRGLKSFRTSPWDPYENLPVDYSRIFQFQNFKRTKRKVMDGLEEEGVIPGTYVTVHIQDVPREAFASYNPSRPYILFTLLPHEHKFSILNFVVKRTEEYDAPVKSKDPVTLHCGFRRYNVRPLFSQHSQGATNNVHKFERFLQPKGTAVATVYAPIQFGPAPVMLWGVGGEFGVDFCPPLIATGSILDLDPTRILAKRIILTGHPFKVHKRGAVIRFMFFNPDDIDYFRPIQLHTKYGRTGHIRESLGTHGYMKCLFDGQLKGQDTVCMSLYKRVFPKWDTEVFREGVGELAYHDNEEEDKMVE
ncbi:hypothetical protein HK097_011022 [Rhizophlyctis rosea]|uniref:Bms1-type G domain-containing protein n=2 Tax=Rhizophlyctis rosea TaxID=64517 RepID=A0AAD5S6X3_9FUNG|nr:hypothetical protein HK097_011022 [Rhizophlyctis rosea]